MLQYTSPMGLVQNAGKLQLFFDVSPPTTELRHELARELFRQNLWRQEVTAGKHLGCVHEVGGGCDEEVYQALGRAAAAAWNAYHFLDGDGNRGPLESSTPWCQAWRPFAPWQSTCANLRFVLQINYGASCMEEIRGGLTAGVESS